MGALEKVNEHMGGGGEEGGKKEEGEEGGTQLPGVPSGSSLHAYLFPTFHPPC